MVIGNSCLTVIAAVEVLATQSQLLLRCVWEQAHVNPFSDVLANSGLEPAKEEGAIELTYRRKGDALRADISRLLRVWIANS